MFAAVETVTKADPVWESRRLNSDVAAKATARESVHAASPLKSSGRNVYNEHRRASMKDAPAFAPARREIAPLRTLPHKDRRRADGASGLTAALCGCFTWSSAPTRRMTQHQRHSPAKEPHLKPRCVLAVVGQGRHPTLPLAMRWFYFHPAARKGGCHSCHKSSGACPATIRKNEASCRPSSIGNYRALRKRTY